MKWKTALGLSLFLVLHFNLCKAQNVRLLSFSALQNQIRTEKSSVLIVNFWATWCKPCLEELPAFETISKKYRLKEVKVLLVSLDFEKDKMKLEKFVKTKKISPEVILLNEPDYDTWISKINDDWSGAIPATLIISTKSGKKAFYETGMTASKLEEEISKFLISQ